MGLYPLLKRNIQNWIYGEDEGHSGSSGPFRPYTINFLAKNEPYHKKESQYIFFLVPIGALSVGYFNHLCYITDQNILSRMSQL